MSKRWNDNKQLLYNVLDELIQEENLYDIKQNVYSFFESELHKCYKNQLNYKSYNEMNKELMFYINKYINFIQQQREIERNREKQQKTKSSSQIEEIYSSPSLNSYESNQLNNTNQINQYNSSPITKEEIQKQRNDLMISEYEKRKKEFEESVKLKPPQDIDFSDKTELPERSIDELYEEELNRRNYENTNFQKNMSMSKEEAEKWIYNGNKPKDMNIEIENREKQRENNENNESNKEIQNNNIIKEPKKVHFNDEILPKIDNNIFDVERNKEKQSENNETNENTDTKPSFLSKLKLKQEKKEKKQNSNNFINNNNIDNNNFIFDNTLEQFFENINNTINKKFNEFENKLDTIVKRIDIIERNKNNETNETDETNETNEKT